MHRIRHLSLLFSGLLAISAMACGSSSHAQLDGGQADGTPGPQVLPACDGTGSGLYVATVTPADGETHVLRSPTIAITMSGEINCPTTSPLTLASASGTVALGPLTCDGLSLAVQPAQDLAYDTAYTLKVTGLEDAQGEEVVACQVTFTVKSKTAAIRSNSGTNLALDEDGTLWTWGDPMGVTLGGGVDPTIPHVVALDGAVVALAMGGGFGLAAVANGTVWAWGDNYYGQLGRGTSADGDTALGQVVLSLPTGVTITDLAAADDHALALRSDGVVMAWGRNDAGQLGDGTVGVVDGIPPNLRATAFAIPGLAGVTAIAAATGSTGHGTYDGGFSLALKSDGTVLGWGSNAFGAIDQILPYPSPPIRASRPRRRRASSTPRRSARG